MKTSEHELFKNILEIIIKLFVVAVIAYYSFQIFKPFFILLVWGIIIAVGILPVYRVIKKIIRGNRYLASFLTVILLISLIALPVLYLSKSFLEGATALAKDFEESSITLPSPNESVKSLPIIGPKLYEFWEQISKNLSSSLLKFAPNIKETGLWILGFVKKIGMEIIFFILAIFIAGVILIYENEVRNFFIRLAEKLSGKYGEEIIKLLGSTTKNVTQGIMGVAMVQATLAGIGLLIAQVPHVGLWAFLVLVVAIVQIPILLVLAPIAVWLFFNSSSGVGIGFLIYGILLSITDTPLRAYFFGRGATTPMPIIFIGAIGGLIQYGILGLFMGALVLAVGYRLFLYWLKDGGAR